ncbi:hypothetical protein L7F22_009645 [Adiantum nelumboides]|nr:hypothetical protein [Adiantum nelumboides]
MNEKTTPTFDFSAFLNSPAGGNDASFSMMGGTGMSNSMSNGLVDSLDNIQNSFGDSINYNDTGILPDWAANSGRGFEDNGVNATTNNSSQDSDMLRPSVASDTPMNVSMTQPINGTETFDGGFTTNYRASIAAHHVAQMNHWLPQMGGAAGGAPAGLGGAGQRSQGGSHSSPSVPLSQASKLNIAKKATELTIQERRRLSRRGVAAGYGVNQPTAMRNVLQPDKSEEISYDIPDTSATVESFSDILPTGNQAIPSIDVPHGHATQGSPEYNNINSDFVRRAYSATGFDLIGALMKVATRPNPKIEIGPVDLSCSFTVSDAQHPDQPIVHCSDTFCQLTGYDRADIIGRNCRFLQSPDGIVDQGTERTHTDNGAVRHIKKHVTRMQECQTSLINYRRDGSPFINLVTIIPITWGDSQEPVYLVGFQVDLVEQPGAVIERKPNGLYVVNYSSPTAMPSVHMLNQTQPPSVPNPIETEANRKAMLAQELAEIMTSGNEESSKWAKILLENSHDIVHVLSLKGTFLYVSPSVEKILGYKPEELVGKSISEFCHPSDIVPVFRELKDSTSNASIAAAARHWARFDGTVNPPTKGGAGQTGPQVNLIMRMKHKDHGHEWIENVGKLHLEQGKGRKVVISTGRVRPIYNLPWDQARRSLNSRAPGFWFKSSVNGLILSTSGNVTSVVEGGSPTSEHNIALTGKHLKDIIDEKAMGSMTSALSSTQVSAIPHLMTNGIGGPSQMVISTVIPSTAGGSTLPAVFVYTQKSNAVDFANLQKDAIYCQEASLAEAQANQAAGLKIGEPAAGSVFGELSTFRSSSWVFELHQLKNANKRLREEVRAHQRRLSSGNRITVGIPHSPSKTKPAVPKLPVMNRFTSNGHSNSNSEISPSPTPFSGSNSGSGTDSTGASSVHSGAASGVPSLKRSRS